MANTTCRSSRVLLLVITTFSASSQSSNAFSTSSSQPLRSGCSQKISKGTSSSLFERRPGNPITGLFSDMASSISSSLMGSGNNLNVSSLDAKLNSATEDSWEDIRSKLEGKQTGEEKAFRSNVEKGIQASPFNKVRLFEEGDSEGNIRVTLYRDHASWCPYCQKVWMSLEEKRIPYRIEKVNMRCYGDKTREFLSLQPNGNIVSTLLFTSIVNHCLFSTNHRIACSSN
jgi:glutathione S-transferase